MDWLINPFTISIVIGLFTLALLRKRKNDNDVSSEMATLEQRAQQIIKRHLSLNAPSYEEVKNEFGYSGFMNSYLQLSKNKQTMSSTADYNVMLELASIDKFRDHTTFLIVSKNSRK